MGEPFVHGLRVRYAECDMQGVVFNSHYLAYFDASITELWRAAFGSYQAMLDRGIDMVVAEAQLRFHSSARFDDQLDLDVLITHLGNTSIVSQHRIRRAATDRGGADRAREGENEVVEGMLRHVLVEAETTRKAQIPDWAREGLAPWTAPAAGG